MELEMELHKLCQLRKYSLNIIQSPPCVVVPHGLYREKPAALLAHDIH